MLNHPDTSAALSARPKDSLGCLSNRLSKDLELDTGEFTLYRKRTESAAMSAVVTPASDRGFLVGVSLRTGHRRRIYSGSRSATHAFEKDSVYVRNFEDDYRAELHGAFDFVLVELSRAFVSDAYYERSGKTLSGFSALPGRKDPVLGHLAQVLALTLDRAREASPLFFEQLGVTIGTHLIDRYGNVPLQSDKKNRRLSNLHESRAKEMLLAKASGHVSIEELRTPAICRGATLSARFAKRLTGRRINGCWNAGSNARANCCDTRGRRYRK